MHSLKIALNHFKRYTPGLLHIAFIAILFLQFLHPIPVVLAQSPDPGDPLSPRSLEPPPAQADDLKHIIIQLNQAPLASAAADRLHLDGNAPLAGAKIADQQARALSSLHSAGIAVAVRRQFKGLLYNGLALTVKSSDIPKIKQLADVAQIYPDEPVHMTLSESVPLIGAPAVWGKLDANDLPVDGLGMTVAILDTGVDYTHPDLGGGFGPGHKVEGGYDLVNDDNNPMDDGGHGTHIAGIIAANGSLKGVAPNAHLLAYKVLNQAGNGQSSDVIAALELALNPDGNANTPDGADVINLSLGFSGSSADPLAQAVNNAVELGVVVVVSAGNLGDDYTTISSPGMAEKAITVAATDDQDQLAFFSSRGPVYLHPEILKPDIAAPGVSILSTVPGSGYVRMSGTSMAVPHVAGAAALIRQLHPTWTPDQVKASLTTSALPLQYGPFEVGAGRLRVDQAAQVPLLVTPNSAGFGISIPDHTTAETLITLQNPGLEPVSATISVSAQYSAYPDFQAVSPTQPVDYLQVDQSSATIDPGASTGLHLRVNVPSSAPDGYYFGQIQILVGSQILRVPVAFSVKTHADYNQQHSGIIGQMGGAVDASATQDHYVYLGHGPRMKIFDVATPASPKLIGQTEVLPGVVNKIVLSGGYAYLTTGRDGMQIIDISNQAAPKRVGSFSYANPSINIAQNIVDLAIAGSYAYLVDRFYGLLIVDISIPEAPRQVSLFSDIGSNTSVAVAGDYAYLGALQGMGGEMTVVDIHDRTAPYQVGSLTTSDLVMGVGVKGHYAYLLEDRAGLRVVDIANPAQPVDIGGYYSPPADPEYPGDDSRQWRGQKLLIEGNLIYVSAYHLGMFIFDITQPDKLALATHAGIPGYTNDVAVLGTTAYVACDLVGLCVEDVSNPAAPFEITEKRLDLPSSVGSIALNSGYAMVANAWNNLAVIDVTYPDDLLNVATYYETKDGHYAGYTIRLVVAGDYTYFANTDGLMIVKTSSVESPTPIVVFKTPEMLRDVAVYGNYAYVTDQTGLRIIDVTDKYHPTQVSFFPLKGAPYAVAVDGNYAYVTLIALDVESNISIIDIRNKSTPAQISGIKLPYQCLDIALAGNNLYIPCNNQGLNIFDITNPIQPIQRSTYSYMPGFSAISSVTVHDQKAYLALGAGGLGVMDVSDPGQPYEVHHIDTPGEAQQVAVAGDYVLVADSAGGLDVIKLAATSSTYLPVIMRKY